LRVPVSLWLRTTLKDYVYENLLGSESRTRNFYRSESLQRILNQHTGGRVNHEKLIRTSLSFELFQQQCGLIF
jgi:asparagine synthase (glutamine-hydrolysing)